MPDGLETMPLDTAGRLLRAKAHELEARIANAATNGHVLAEFDYLAADVALVAELLAMALDRIAALEGAPGPAARLPTATRVPWDDIPWDDSGEGSDHAR